MEVSIKNLASQIHGQLETRRRESGEEFICLKDDAPEWMTDVIHAAHGDQLPNDWRYEFISEAIEALTIEDDEEEARCILEPSIYTYELTAWLASRNDRHSYSDEYDQMMGAPDDDYPAISRIMNGQMMERWETFDLLHAALFQLTENIDQEAI